MTQRMPNFRKALGLACAALFSEHFPQSLQHFCRRADRQTAQTLDQTFTVDRSKLIEGDEPRASLEPAGNPPGICVPAGRHGCDNDCTQVLV